MSDASRKYFEQAKPNLKSYLIAAGYAGEEEDGFDRALRGMRTEDSPLLAPRNIDLED